jgi:antitoxin Phd
MKETTWPLQDAKNRLSELVDRAKAGVPQIITRRGEQVVVVVGIEDFEKISAREQDLVVPAQLAAGRRRSADRT